MCDEIWHAEGGRSLPPDIGMDRRFTAAPLRCSQLHHDYRSYLDAQRRSGKGINDNCTRQTDGGQRYAKTVSALQQDSGVQHF